MPAPPRPCIVASQDVRVLANGVNTHTRLLVAALARLGAPPRAVVTPVDSAAGRARLFAGRVRGRLARDPDRRALEDLERRHALLVAHLRARPEVADSEVVHAQDFVAAAALLDALGPSRPPLVLAHHANALPAAELSHRLGLSPTARAVAWAERESRRAFAAAARVVAVSPWAARALAADGAVAPERLATVPNGVPVPDAPPPAADREAGLVLAVGQVVERKGFDVLVDAMARLARTRRVGAAKAVVLGDGPERARLVARAQRAGAPVTFPGAVADVGAWLARAGVFALPSRAENLPMALLEAMAQGLAAVASEVGGVAEALAPDGGPPAGLLVPPGDVDALAAALERLLTDPDLARAMGERAHALARARHSLEAMARAWLEVYAGAALPG
ncbi:MAG: glycosyltransferase family 4 protein [Firmicutes bacterium]|nr:glycosyltransferase family 4 protein [Bacillota bacterium]